MIIVNLLLAVVLAPLLMVGDRAWLIYLVLAVSSCLSPFFLAAEATMVPEMITDPSLRITANAINSQVRDVSRLIGAALGGVLAAAGGISALALGDVISFIVAAALIAMIRHRPPRHDDAPAGWIRGELAEGFAVIRRSRPLAVILLFMVVTGIGEAIMGTLFAPFVHDLLRGGAADFGRIVAAQAIGGILGGVLISLLGHRRSPAALFGWGAVLFGLLDLALFCYPLVAGEWPPIWPAMVIIALVGLPGAALVAGMTTTLQDATTDRVRGRVFGTVTAAQNGAMLGITLVVGLISPRLGIVTMLIGQGLGYVLAGLLVIVALRRIDPEPVRAGREPRVSAGRQRVTPCQTGVMSSEPILRRADGQRSGRAPGAGPPDPAAARGAGRTRRHHHRGRGGTPAGHQPGAGQSPSAPARQVRLRRTGRRRRPSGPAVAGHLHLDPVRSGQGRGPAGQRRTAAAHPGARFRRAGELAAATRPARRALE